MDNSRKTNGLHYKKLIKKSNVLSSENIFELTSQLQRDPQNVFIKSQLVESQFKLIAQLIFRFIALYNWNSFLSIDDLFFGAYLQLYQSITNYKPQIANLSTYAGKIVWNFLLKQYRESMRNTTVSVETFKESDNGKCKIMSDKWELKIDPDFQRDLIKIDESDKIRHALKESLTTDEYEVLSHIVDGKKMKNFVKKNEYKSQASWYRILKSAQAKARKVVVELFE